MSPDLPRRHGEYAARGRGFCPEPAKKSDPASALAIRARPRALPHGGRAAPLGLIAGKALRAAAAGPAGDSACGGEATIARADPRPTMTWHSTYLAKHVAQKCLGAAPGLYRLQEWFKARSGRWDRFLDVDFVRARAAQKAEQLERAGLGVPRRAVEQGTGWHGLDLVLLHLAGTERVDTYDTRPWLQPALLARVCAHAGVVAEAAAAWSAVDRRAARERARALERAAREEDPDALLARLGARYRVTTDCARPELEDGGVDLFFSDSVLQRVRPADLRTLAAEARRFLAPDGAQHHVVDCKDFHSITDPRVPELAYLTFGAWTWERLTSTYLNYQNRWRKADFVALFEAAGMELALHGVLRDEENLRWLRERAPRLRLEREAPLDEVAVTRFELCARPARAAVRLAG